jgi:CDP-diacylglycerol--glycerol-3-phosphate 3-phosphatidyltransferase
VKREQRSSLTLKGKIFQPRDPDSFYSEANIITLVRLVGSLVFFALAILKKSPTYNFIGLGLHWFGDVLDGFCARRCKQETILGAEIDIIADRIETLFFYINFLHFHPNLIVPATIYILDFAFVDFYLSYQFLKYDIISPNYFFKVNKTVYILNYSPVAKFCNSTVVTLILIFLPQIQILAAFFAAVLIAIKSFSIYLLNKKRPVGIRQSSPRKEKTE